MERFGTLDNSEKTIAILGDTEDGHKKRESRKGIRKSRLKNNIVYEGKKHVMSARATAGGCLY